MEYYIEATDGINTAYVGSEESPCVIDIDSDCPTTTTTTTVTSPYTTTISSTTTTSNPVPYQNTIIKIVIVSDANPDQAMEISAYIYDNVNVRNITLYYKYSTNKTWSSINMNNDSNELIYSAVIPSSKIKEGTFEYYIEAYDSTNHISYGSRNDPITVQITASDVISQTTTTITTTTTSTTTTTATTSATTTATTSTTTSTTTTAPTSTTTSTTTTVTTSNTTSITTTFTTTLQTSATTSTTTTVPPLTLPVTSIAINNGEQYAIPITSTGITFKSSNTDVAVISLDGIVTAVGAGEAVISIIDKDYNVIQLKVTVIQNEISYKFGDIDNDGKINAVDATYALVYYANISTKKEGGLTESQQKAADVDNNGDINAVDASYILSYYAYTSTTKEAIMPIEEYMKKK